VAVDHRGCVRAQILRLAGSREVARRMVTSLITETLRQGIAGSQCVIFKHSAHMPHLEPQRVFVRGR
jgi:hypothetical protein